MKNELGTMSARATKVSANRRRPCGGSKVPVAVSTRRPSILPAAAKSIAPRRTHVETWRTSATSTNPAAAPKANRVAREELDGTNVTLDITPPKMSKRLATPMHTDENHGRCNPEHTDQRRPMVFRQPTDYLIVKNPHDNSASNDEGQDRKKTLEHGSQQ